MSGEETKDAGVRRRVDAEKERDAETEEGSLSLRIPASTRPRVASSLIPLSSSLIPKLKRALRGEVDARTVALEMVRRTLLAAARRRERRELARLDETPARLVPRYARLKRSALLQHFRTRGEPRFLPGLEQPEAETAQLQRTLFPAETEELIAEARRITDAHCWRLLGFGEKCFGEEINWRRDPLSGYEWPLDYHADIQFTSRADGSDVRVLWELNRFHHFLVLGRAYSVTHDERFAEEFFLQLEGWQKQNPLGRGANWACAMEVALRSINLLAAFQLFRRSPHLDERRLQQLLNIFDQHGAHIRRNLEFSYIATSNHYLSDVAGLLWLGVMLPELKDASGWRAFGWRELLSEMDKQVLADGADFEASTGYHRFVLELFLYSFLLCRENGVEIPERYSGKLRAMVEYVRAYLRPDARAPLVGDTDGGQVLPVKRRAADDHAYVLALGACVFDEPRFKDARQRMPEEVLWLMGAEGVRRYENLAVDETDAISNAFAEAGTYVMRERDLYLLFNASGTGVGGRGSHGHNDALSLEVSACGSLFLVDPGTYVYTADLAARHFFRSTRAHSTVEVDETEQNTTGPNLPFVMGAEATPRVVEWETGPLRDMVVAEHGGYERLAHPVTHRRRVVFDKQERFWLVEDLFTGAGEHVFSFRFHLAAGVEPTVRPDGSAAARDRVSGAQLFISLLDSNASPKLETNYASDDYGARASTLSLCWTLRAGVPLKVRFALVPICAGEDEAERLALITKRAGARPTS